jgi:hypothetical protein
MGLIVLSPWIRKNFMANTRRTRKNSSRSSKKPVKRLLYDLEKIVDRLIDECGWQWGDLFYWLYGHLKIHRPDAQEEYEDGTNPKFEYGPEED